MSVPRPAPLATTGIGSLPHTQLELALQQALQPDVPYLPQLPRRDPAEYMIAQALEGLPGLRYDDAGTVQIDGKRWEAEASAFLARLEAALGGDPRDLEPSSTGSAAWRPFLWEVSDRRLPFAKAQIAGPTTVRWAATLDDGRRVADVPELERALYRLVLARALAMVRALRERGTTPIFFFDEPGLVALDPADPRHFVLLQELKIAVLALRVEGALVGVHCCGNTAWDALLDLGMDYLSLDVHLSIEAVRRSREALGRFLAGGGRLALGLIPTNVGARYALADLCAAVRAIEAVPLVECLLTPACGLALRTVPECEGVFEELAEGQRVLRG
jgi:methionine synthase II (cobalamin-independent)